jgi:hypothetical protein
MYEDGLFVIGFCLGIGLGAYVGMGSNWEFELGTGNGMLLMLVVLSRGLMSGTLGGALLGAVAGEEAWWGILVGVPLWSELDEFALSGGLRCDGSWENVCWWTF